MLVMSVNSIVRKVSPDAGIHIHDGHSTGLPVFVSLSCDCSFIFVCANEKRSLPPLAAFFWYASDSLLFSFRDDMVAAEVGGG